MVLRRDILSLPVPDRAKTAGWKFFLFLFRAMGRQLARTLTFYGALLIGGVALLRTGFTRDWGVALHAGVSVAVTMLAISLVVLVEEYGHGAACIRKGKGDCIRELRVASWRSNWVSTIVVEQFGVRIQGITDALDVVEIAAAGPELALCLGGTVFAILWALGITDPHVHRTAFLLSTALVLFPVSSLLPVRRGLLPFVPDGTLILELRRDCHLSGHALLRHLAHGLLLAIVWWRMDGSRELPVGSAKRGQL